MTGILMKAVPDMKGMCLCKNNAKHFLAHRADLMLGQKKFIQHITIM